MFKYFSIVLCFWALQCTNLHAQAFPVFSAKSVNFPANVDLDSVLIAYRVYELKPSELKAHLQSDTGIEKQFTLELPDLGAWAITLTLRPLLSDTYRLHVDDGQKIQELPGPGDITWVGYLTGDAVHKVSLTVDDHFIFGSIHTPEGDFFIEPLGNLVQGSLQDRFIVYKTGDVIPNSSRTCGVTEVSGQTIETGTPVADRNVGLCKHAELAIASDFGMFTRYTNATEVQNHNIAVMNEVANDYDDAFDDAIYFLITTQYVSSTSTSSLDVALTSTTNADNLLNNFRNWSIAGNFGTSYDLAQLWVIRNICSNASGCSTVGLAFSSDGVCGDHGYHILEDFSYPNPVGWELRVLTSHEIGHNFSCTHDPSGSLTIMAPSVNNTTTWSAQSLSEVNGYLPTISCLFTCDANFSASTYSATEFVSGTYLPTGDPSCGMGYTEFMIPIQYSSGSGSGGSVTASVVGGTATQNLDYNLPNPTITFPAGANTQTVNLPVRIWNDAISEGNETIDLQLTGGLVGSQNTATINILSDDLDPATSYLTYSQFGTSTFVVIVVPFHGLYQDSRTQIVLGASELSAAGFAANDIISGLALEVSQKSSTQPYNGFTIGMKHTTAPPTITGPLENGVFTTVYSANYTTIAGWNKFDFTQGFVWDGVSNVRIQFCYDNASSTHDDRVRTSSGGNTVAAQANAGSGCTLPPGTTLTYFERPNIRIYKGNDIAITLGNASDTNLKNGETAYFKDAQNEFVLAIQQTSGADAGCVHVEIDRAGTGRQNPPWLQPGYFVSDKAYFVTADNPGATYDITLYYSKAEMNVWGAAANSLNIVKSSVPIANADASNVLINESIVRSTFGPPTNSDAYYSFKGAFSGLSGFAVTDATQGLLPVKWLDFTGKLVGENVLLTWATAVEKDNKGFDVERSDDGGLSFKKIGFVESRGTNAPAQPYYFEDNKALQANVPILYYRLKQIDTDVKFSYSKIVSVNLSRNNAAWQIMPNPTRNEVVLQRNGCSDCRAAVSLTDAEEREVLTQQVDSANTVMDLSRIPSGVYLVTVRSDDGDIWQTRLVRL